MEKLVFKRNYYDAIVVGARCAGSATAMLLAKAGAKVLVVDRQPYGSDTLSTHALMRPAVIQLSRWGLLDKMIESGAPVVTATSFHYGKETVTVPIREESGVPGLLAPRRVVLDRILVDAARSAGAEIYHDVIVEELIRAPNGRVNGVAVRDHEGNRAKVDASVVVGADGIGSTVARQAGARMITRGKHSAGNIFGYAPVKDLKGYHWHFHPGYSAGSIPTHDGKACIFVSAPTARFDSELRHDLAKSHAEILRHVAPEIGEQVAREHLSPLRAFRGVPGFIREAHGPGWVLVGDSGFFRDPITSHGISDAFRDAEGAAKAILAGTDYDFRRYQEERDSFAYPMLEVTDAICAFDWTFEQLAPLHKQFSTALKNESAALLARDGQNDIAHVISANDNQKSVSVATELPRHFMRAQSIGHKKEGELA
jgi:flavin-dependent dehydrogenase